MNQEDYLQHYGVLGMKWGQRKVRKYNEKSAKLKYKSSEYTGKKSTKYSDRSKKLNEKARKKEKRHTELAGGKDIYDDVKKMSTIVALAQSYSLGSYGSLKLRQLNSREVSSGKAAIKTWLYVAGNLSTLGMLSIIEPRISARNKRNK